MLRNIMVNSNSVAETNIKQTKNSHNALQIIYQNVRGLRTKVNEFYVSLIDNPYDVICLSESWLSDDISSNELFSSAYTVFRCDRRFGRVNRTRGGGVVVAIKNSFSVSKLDLSELISNIPLVDIVGCKINFLAYSLYIFALYIPPHMPVQDLESFFEYLENYVSTENKILIVGDFNIPSFHDQSNDSVATLLNQFLALTNLAQLNKVLNDNGRILDLVLSNITDVAVMLHDSPPVKPDKHHPPLLIDILLRTPSTRNFPLCGINRKFNFKLCNFHELYSALFATDWEFLYKIDDTNDACLQFYNKIRVLLER